MSDNSEDDTHVLTEVEHLERDKSIMAGEIRRLARNLLRIAELAMPDTYFTTDSRCRYARAMLTKHKKARR